jgi:hypothetical protein
VAGREGEDEIATEGSGSDMIPKGAWRGWEGKEKDTRTPDHQMEKKERQETEDWKAVRLACGKRYQIASRCGRGVERTWPALVTKCSPEVLGTLESYFNLI